MILIRVNKLISQWEKWVDCSGSWASLVAQRLKHLPAMQETWVPSLGRKDPLEKEMATHSSILAWRIPWTEEPGGHSPQGCKELDMTEGTQHAWGILILVDALLPEPF